jgi:glycosyltransferase involved in cell wall biosynthesis
MNLFSICIPTYEMSGYGPKMLRGLFDNLKSQTVQDFEIIISDQSEDLETYKVCEEYSDVHTIKYIKNFYANGRSAHNLNICLDSSTGKIIKVIFEDDYFLDCDALKKIANKYNEGYKWVMNSFTHTQDDENFFNYMTPSLNDHLLDGVNTMGNPSNLSFLRSHKQYFDEDLLYLVDCEFYYRMNLLYGCPGIVNDTLVAIRYHESSATMNPEFISKKDVEINYCANKYYDILKE